MRQRMRWAPAAILLAALVVPIHGAGAAPPGDEATGGVTAEPRSLAPDAKVPALARREARQLAAQAGVARTAGRSQVGDEKLWLALDDAAGEVYVKDYTLRAIGDHIEVWVASDEGDVSSGTDFPAGDCRNGARTAITDEQVQYLADQFDGTIYPNESDVFSVPPRRNGQGAELAEILGLPANYYRGQGDDIVVLVDNVRDENFYDTNNSQSLTYIAGFFANSFNELANRNVMTIDAFDWLHRTGPNPPHEPTDDPCTSAPARPSLYEGVFAHEYQHLLEYYEDDGESNWVNEGLSDWAQTLTGYVDPSIPVDQLGYDSHVQCFQGYLGVETDYNPIPREGGPENSLTLWGDQTDHESEVLCDYGAAYTFMEYLHDRYGNAFMGELHRDDRHGLVGLRRTLRANGIGVKPTTLLDRWAASVALDAVLDDGARLRGANPGGFTVDTLDASVNWDTPEAYSAPGAPPNGSDYVRLRDGSGMYLSADELESLSFDGAEELPMLPIGWEVDASGGSGGGSGSGDPALYSGTGDNLDRSIVREVDVPTGAGAELTFEGQWSLEEGYDYGYVQVSTDGGETYDPIACSDQVDGPLGPAFNGESDGFLPVTCDLSAWAGETVVIGFRLVTDGSVFLDGFWVDDVAVGGTPLSDGSTLDGWSSPTEYNPIDVRSFSVRLIGYTDDRGRAWTKNLPLGDGFAAELDADALRAALGDEAETVAAIVTYHDPTETVLQAAPYELVVNGVPQPGGGDGGAG